MSFHNLDRTPEIDTVRPDYSGAAVEIERQDMARWRVSNVEKNTIREHELWAKDDATKKQLEVIRVSTFYSGAWIVETDDEDAPCLDDDPLDMNELDYETEVVELNGGTYSWKFPRNVSKSEREKIVSGYDQDGPDFMYENGWANHVTQCFVLGEVEVEGLDE